MNKCDNVAVGQVWISRYTSKPVVITGIETPDNNDLYMKSIKAMISYIDGSREFRTTIDSFKYAHKKFHD